jgi:uncharacterized membrane protein
MPHRSKLGAGNKEDQLPAARLTLVQWVRNRFITGVVIAAPIGVTLFLVSGFIAFVDNRVKPFIPERWNPETYLSFAVPGLGLILAVVALTLLGALTANFLGRSVLSTAERIVARVPLVRNIYSALKQIFQTLASNRAASFQEVVLVEYPRVGVWAVGFVSREARGEVALALGDDYAGVFVPTTPNPTSGFLIYVRRSEMKTLKMTVEEGAKLIISAGLVMPGDDAEAIAEALEAQNKAST